MFGGTNAQPFLEGIVKIANGQCSHFIFPGYIVDVVSDSNECNGLKNSLEFGALHDIFISYSSKHRDLTRTLAAAIEAQYGAGSVWWDHALESWGDYEIQIRNALNEAQAVVVIWTKEAGDSDWVKDEAGRANRDGKLVNEPAEAPPRSADGAAARDAPGRTTARRPIAQRLCSTIWS
jgi:TIR domain-containing protein